MKCKKDARKNHHGCSGKCCACVRQLKRQGRIPLCLTKDDSSTLNGGSTRQCKVCVREKAETAASISLPFGIMYKSFEVVLRFLIKVHGIKPAKHYGPCIGCIRNGKTALKKASRSFRWLNDRLDPYFDRMVDELQPQASIKHQSQSGESHEKY
jgi:hypothetical protein